MLSSPRTRTSIGLLLALSGPFASAPADARPWPANDPPVHEDLYLKASNTGSLDLFGASIAVSGDTLIIGAPGEHSASRGPNADPEDDGAPFAGAVYVFVRTPAGWIQQSYLKASNASSGDLFGHSVAIDGDTLVVTARFEASGARGVNGDENDDDRPRAGAAYVFVRSGSTWTQQAYLKASNTDADDQFGRSVAISGDTIAIGARNEASGAKGVDGDEEDDGVPGAGAVYVFVREGSRWSQQAYLKASNTGKEDYFGRSLALSRDTLLVGAPDEDGRGRGVDGEEDDDSLLDSGAAYVFVREGSLWKQQAYLKASRPRSADLFGLSVALQGDTAVIGAAREDGPVDDSGAVYVFRRRGETWEERARLEAPVPLPASRFGNALAIEGRTLLVASSGDESTVLGAAHLFEEREDGWFHRRELRPSRANPRDAFGSSIALHAERAFVGAQTESSAAKGIQGDPANDRALGSGAVYGFARAARRTAGR